jgi:hypothetical protein
MTRTGDKDMTQECHHTGTCEQFREKFLDHTAAAVVAVATATHPNDPVAASTLALSIVGWTPSLADRPMDTSDIDPDTGEEFGVGPDYDTEQEIADEASQELAEQETGQ